MQHPAPPAAASEAVACLKRRRSIQKPPQQNVFANISSVRVSAMANTEKKTAIIVGKLRRL